MIIVCIFAEGAFDRRCDYATKEEAQAFAWGVTVGSSLYGAGSCTTYVLPDDEAEMLKHERSEEVARALQSNPARSL